MPPYFANDYSSLQHAVAQDKAMRGAGVDRSFAMALQARQQQQERQMREREFAFRQAVANEQNRQNQAWLDFQTKNASSDNSPAAIRAQKARVDQALLGLGTHASPEDVRQRNPTLTPQEVQSIWAMEVDQQQPQMEEFTRQQGVAKNKDLIPILDKRAKIAAESRTTAPWMAPQNAWGWVGNPVAAIARWAGARSGGMPIQYTPDEQAALTSRAQALRSAMPPDAALAKQIQIDPRTLRHIPVMSEPAAANYFRTNNPAMFNSGMRPFMRGTNAPTVQPPLTSGTGTNSVVIQTSDGRLFNVPSQNVRKLLERDPDAVVVPH